jgi:hypothetical protein
MNGRACMKQLLMQVVYILLVQSAMKVGALIISSVDALDARAIRAHPASIFL